MYPFICSVRSSYKMEHGRGPGKHSFLYSQVPGRQSLVDEEATGESSPRQWALSSRRGGEREGADGSEGQCLSRGSSRAKGEGGSQWQVWMPVVTVRGGQESNWWQGQPSRWGTWPSWWDVYTPWGCSDSRKVWSFKIYSRDSQVLGFFFKCFFLLLLHCAAYRIFPHQESSMS